MNICCVHDGPHKLKGAKAVVIVNMKVVQRTYTVEFVTQVREDAVWEFRAKGVGI